MSYYKTWLRTLGTRRADMPAVVRGLPMAHRIALSGDMTSASLTGSVKASPDSTSVLAAFSISDPVFADGVTTWDFGLSRAQTGALPAGDEGESEFIFDFLLTPSGGLTERLFGGLFPVSGFVTEPV